jgi:hypothetical protein
MMTIGEPTLSFAFEMSDASLFAHRTLMPERYRRTGKAGIGGGHTAQQDEGDTAAAVGCSSIIVPTESRIKIRALQLCLLTSGQWCAVDQARRQTERGY